MHIQVEVEGRLEIGILATMGRVQRVVGGLMAVSGLTSGVDSTVNYQGNVVHTFKIEQKKLWSPVCD